MERWLDEMHGSCALRDSAASSIVAEILQHFDGQRYRQFAWVVMPNHVHALFSLSDGETLEQTLQGWKGVSSRRVNAMMGQTGTLWQKDYFDRFVRDARHFWNCAGYIRRNPEKACLKVGEFVFYESDFVKTTLDAIAR